MKKISYILAFCAIAGTSCKKVIDLYPQSNLNTGTYYSDYNEVKSALTGAYNGLQAPLFYEWQLTELRSDNSKQGQTGSTSSQNRDLSDLDMFLVSPAHQGNYNYWLNTYGNIRNINLLLQKIGVVYDPAAARTEFTAMTFPFSESDRKQLAGEALFLRAYHYFNLVRLYGGVFLNHKPLTPSEAKSMDRATVDQIYDFIEADLATAIASMNTLRFNQMPVADLGRATGWAAKALLAKVYLTQNRKADAIPLLVDVKDNSGYGLHANYTNVFSVGNEMNNEIIFAVRYKAPGLGLGSPFANMFAPLQSGATVVLGDGDGLNYPTSDLDTATMGDGRRSLLIASYSAAGRLYTKKYLSTVTVADDAENDWPVIRYADVLLMLAEAQGFTPESISLISQVRQRGGNSAIDPATITSVAAFEQLLSHERRIELAFENQRWFDLVRFNTTLSTITAEQTLKDHFADEYYTHYRQYTAPAVPLASLQSYVTAQKLLLPIPQREFDTNPALIGQQNPGY